MAVMSVRMNREEENMMNYLSEYFGEEKSSIIKRWKNSPHFLCMAV